MKKPTPEQIAQARLDAEHVLMGPVTTQMENLAMVFQYFDQGRLPELAHARDQKAAQYERQKEINLTLAAENEKLRKVWDKLDLQEERWSQEFNQLQAGHMQLQEERAQVQEERRHLVEALRIVDDQLELTEEVMGNPVMRIPRRVIAKALAEDKDDPPEHGVRLDTAGEWQQGHEQQEDGED